MIIICDATGTYTTKPTQRFSQEIYCQIETFNITLQQAKRLPISHNYLTSLIIMSKDQF